MKDKIVLGLVEEVTLYGTKGKKAKILARIDTGAQHSSIDQALAADLQLGPILKNKAIRQSHGRSLRPVVEVKTSLCGKKLTGEFTISNRAHMKYKALIGQNLLRQGFIIDPCKYESGYN
jgi:hypothetical protein